MSTPGLIHPTGAADKGKPLVQGENTRILAVMIPTINNNPENMGLVKRQPGERVQSLVAGCPAGTHAADPVTIGLMVTLDVGLWIRKSKI